jgi:hypothetical protein
MGTQTIEVGASGRRAVLTAVAAFNARVGRGPIQAELVREIVARSKERGEELSEGNARHIVNAMEDGLVHDKVLVMGTQHVGGTPLRTYTLTERGDGEARRSDGEGVGGLTGHSPGEVASA